MPRIRRPPKKDIDLLVDAIRDQTEDSGKWQSIQNETLRAGLAEVVKAIREKQTPTPPANKVEVKFMFIVKNDHPDEPFSIELGEVTDGEGNVIPDAQVDVAVTSTNEDSVVITFDPATRAGSAHFSNAGVASVEAAVSSKGVLLGSGSVGITVTLGDPAAISGVAISFPGLTEAPE